MKVRITKTYDLSNENDEWEYKQDLNARQNALHYHLYTDSFENFLRERIKYAELTDIEYKVYEEIREKYFEIRNEYDIEDDV